MHLRQLQHDQQHCLRVAAEALGEPVRALVLDEDVEQPLLTRLRRESRVGLDGGPVVVRFVDERRGHRLELGVDLFRLRVEGDTIRLAHVMAPRNWDATESCYEFWAVPRRHYRRFYRFARQLLRQRQRQAPPLLRAQELARLWSNTIGFLRHGGESLKRYGVPQKRGVLLLGEPGNGKTMACRWLRDQCNRFRLAWDVVTAEQFEAARGEGNAHALFQLDRPGVKLFDDVDLGVREGRGVGHSGPQSTLLCGLDGLDVHCGVVYLFTSNARMEDLDPAFRRPGRIDLVMHFPRPEAALRRRFIAEHWHADIATAINVERAVADTEGLSFAELDEVKKLLVLGFLENGRWDWHDAWESFVRGRNDGGSRRAIGFNCHESRGRACQAARLEM
ncbi:MAG: AAA family ATPase [Pirellulales bacterium]